MPYDPFDPLADYDHLMSMDSVPPDVMVERELNRAMGIPNRKPAAFPALPAAEQKSAIDSILDTTGSALGYVADTLDKPGRAIRGLLGGKPEEALNVLPFSDALGLTSEHGLLGGTPFQVTSKANAVGGRDLLEGMGLAPANQPGLADPDDAAWDVAGFGVELLTDPLTYLGGLNAVGKAGTIAKQLGKLPKSVSGRMGSTLKGVLETASPLERELAELSAGKMGTTLSALEDEALGGLFGIGAPLSNGPHYIPDIAKGPTAQKIAGGLEKVHDTLRYGKVPLTDYSPGQHLASLFDAKQMGAVTPEISPRAEELHAGLNSDVVNIRGKYAADALERAGKGFGTDEFSDTLRSTMEGVGDDPFTASVPMMITGKMKERLRDLGHTTEQIRNMTPQEAMDVLNAVVPPKSGEAAKYASGLSDKYRTSIDDAYKESQRVGTKVDPLVDKAGVQYTPRSSVDEGPASFVRGREEHLKHWENGTDTVRRIVSDPKVKEFGSLQEAADYLNQSYGHMYKDPAAREEAMLTLASKIRNEYSDEAVRRGLFGSDVMTDLRDFEITSKYKTRSADFVAQAIADHAVPLGEFSGQTIGKDGIKRMPTAHSGTVRAALKKAGFDDLDIRSMSPAQAAEELAQRGIKVSKQADPQGAQATIEDLLRQAGLEPAASKIEYGSKVKTGLSPEFDYNTGALSNVMKKMGFTDTEIATEAIRQQVAKMRVDDRIARDILGVGKGFMQPEAVSKLMGAFDLMQGYFKAGVLAWPARYVRDLTSGQAMNVLTGNFSLSAFDDALRLIKGGGSKTAMEMPYVQAILKQRGLPATPENATSVLKEVLASVEATTGSQRGLDALKTPPKGGFSGGAHEFLRELPGQEPQTLKSIATAGSSWSPLNVKGVAGNVTTEFRPFAISEEAGRYTDALNRVVPVIEQLRKGATPEYAKQVSDAIQVSYNPRSYTKFEKTFLKRMFPFYSYSSRMIPEVLKQIAERPGGRLATLIKASNSVRSDESFVPPYVGEGLAIPWPGNPNRFVSQFGLPTDQISDIMAVGRNPAQTIRRNMQKLASQMTPAVKLPIELATGTNLYTGRPLEETYQFPFSDPVLNELVSNSPLARVSKGVRTLGDDRKELPIKALNLLTGAQITDISGGVERQKELASRKILQQLMKENPQIKQNVSNYLPADVVPTDETRHLLRVEAGLKQHAREAAKKEKRVRKLRPADSLSPL